MLVAEPIQEKSEVLPLVENNSVSVSGRELKQRQEQELQHTKESVFWQKTILLRTAYLRLLELGTLKENWDSYAAPPPNEIALRNAARILRAMQPFDLASATIVPSAEGGIGVCFVKGERYADLEASNEGAILGVRYVGMQAPVLIETDGTDDSVDGALTEIRNHLRA